MPMMQPFAIPANTLPISVTSTASTSAALPNVGDQIRIVNEGPNVCFVSIGTGAQTATLPNATFTTTSNPIYIGETELTIPHPFSTGGSSAATSAPTPLNISAICRSGQTATLSVQVGSGL